MFNKKVGFIGCGNMGGALAIAASKVTKNIYLANRTMKKAEDLAAQLGVHTSTNEEIAGSCDFIFLGVKPHLMAGMLATIADALGSRAEKPVLITMAAGVSMADIQKYAGGKYPVIRIMPNTPVSLGCGLILYCSTGVSGETMEEFLELMQYSGSCDPLEENLMDVGSAVSGCGPAYVYQFIEAMADGGVACGLPRAKAMAYAAQTLVGAAQMVLTSGNHPGALKDAVCSPGGSTIQGIRALEKGGLRSTVMEAVIAAYEKNTKLGK